MSNRVVLDRSDDDFLVKVLAAAGNQVVVIDTDASSEFALDLAEWVSENREEYDLDFHQFFSQSSGTQDASELPTQGFYEPLGSCSVESKTSMVLGMREYHDASSVYRAAMTRLLRVLFSATESVEKIRSETGDTGLCDFIDWDNGGFYQLVSASETENFHDLMEFLIGSEYIVDEDVRRMAKDTSEEVQKRNSMLRHALTELQGQVQTIMSSEYGVWMREMPGSVSLSEASRAPGSVVLFSLGSEDKEASLYVTRMLEADLAMNAAS